jgi:hypothetical protein
MRKDLGKKLFINFKADFPNLTLKLISYLVMKVNCQQLVNCRKNKGYLKVAFKNNCSFYLEVCEKKK